MKNSSPCRINLVCVNSVLKGEFSDERKAFGLVYFKGKPFNFVSNVTIPSVLEELGFIKDLNEYLTTDECELNKHFFTNDYNTFSFRKNGMLYIFSIIIPTVDMVNNMLAKEHPSTFIG